LRPVAAPLYDFAPGKEATMRRGVLAAVALGAVLAGAASCGSSRGGGRRDATPVPSDRVAGARRPGEHWVQGERLRQVMRQVSQQARRWPTGVPADPEAAQSAEAQAEGDESFRDAAALADGLAEAARRIPRSVADHPMSADDRRAFTAEAERLRTQALELRRAARGRRVEQMQRRLDAIGATCVSCHSQYRDLAGDLDPRRARAE
jgi:cytochrome c556